MIINEYRYSKEDTISALQAYYGFFKKTVIMHYAPLPLAAVCMYLMYSSGLKRFAIFAAIFLLIFLMRYAQIALAAKYDAMRMNEETGVPDPMIRYEIDSEIRVYRQNKLHVTIPLEDIVGCKDVKGSLAIFTKGNYTLYLRDGRYIEGGATMVKAMIRDMGVQVK